MGDKDLLPCSLEKYNFYTVIIPDKNVQWRTPTRAEPNTFNVPDLSFDR